MTPIAYYGGCTPAMLATRHAAVADISGCEGGLQTQSVSGATADTQRSAVTAAPVGKNCRYAVRGS